ncbi:MAG: aryl-sulfate sulfotransferase [bacterium]
MMTKQLLAALALLGLLMCSMDTVPLSAADEEGGPQFRQAQGRDGGGRRGRGRERQQVPEKVGLIQNGEKAFQGYTLLTPMNTTTTYLIDNDGKVVNKWETKDPVMCAYLLKNGHLLAATSSGIQGNSTFHGGGAGERVQKYTWEGNLVWDFEYSTDEHLLHHDIEPLPNGNVLMIAWERKNADEAIAAGRDPDAQGEGDLWADHIIEVKPTGKTTGEIVWEWHVWDHLIQDADPSRPNYGDLLKHPELVNINPLNWVEQLSPSELDNLRSLGYVHVPTGSNRQSSHPDWNHTNGISYNPELDQIALSVLGFNEVWIIDHSTTTKEAADHTGGKSGKGGDLLYRWGNPMAYGAGTKEDQQLFAQHDVTWVQREPNETWSLLVFNNGRGRPDGDYSSVDEIVLPIDRRGRYKLEIAYGPDKPVWSYTASKKEDFFSGHISGAQRLPNGNTLICSGETGTLFEVTEEGEVVWEYVNPNRSAGRFGPGMGRGGPGGRGFRGMRDMDEDNDGQVTFEEASVLPFMNEERFKDLDAAEDGVLSEEELARGPRRGLPPGIDKDSDNSLTYDEASNLPFMNEEMFKQLDKDGNGSLSLEELPPPPGMPSRGMPGPGMGGPPPFGGPGGMGPGRGGPGGGGRGEVFKVRRYEPDYPGLLGWDLTPGDPIKADVEPPAEETEEGRK